MLDISYDQVLVGELEPEEKEELAEKIGKMLQRDRCGVSQMAVLGDAGGENGGNTVSGWSVHLWPNIINHKKMVVFDTAILAQSR